MRTFRLPRHLKWPILLCLLALPAFAAAQSSDLLQVTDAFKLSARIDTPGAIHLHWAIAPHYYLYRGRIKAKALASGAQLGTLQLPNGLKEHDPYLGDVEIYHDALDATQPYTINGATPASLRLAVTFQGCHEVAPKICYPPYTQKLDLPLPAAALTAPTTTTSRTDFSAALQRLGHASGTAATKAPPLPPGQAFVFDAIATAPNALLLRWTMPPGYYLYRDQTRLNLTDADGVTLGIPKWPMGAAHADAHFGTTTVYFDEVALPVPLTRTDGAPRNVTLRATFQGCQDGGLCYPPMTRTLSIALPPKADATAVAPVVSDANASIPAVDESYEQQLAARIGGHGFAAIALFFGFGLLLAFTPCVLPMIPILSGLIVGAGEKISTARAFTLSLVYVLATCVVFTVAGIAAGLAGANLSAWMQKPAILIAFAILFVLLALSMFGLYSLQLPASWQTRLANLSNRQRGGSLIGVAVMGVLSALIVGPCVAPPLAAAVLYIGQSRDPVFGGAALFALSLGMGVPLLIIGTAAGRWLPRAGAWMDVVKAVFGVMFLGVAIFMLSRVLDAPWILALTGALLIGCAVFLGTLSRHAAGISAWRRFGQALGVIALIIGACELVGAAAGSRDLLRPLAVVFGGAPSQANDLSFRRVKSVDNVERAVAAASRSGQPAMLDFYADWCVSCKEMEAQTFSKPDVQHALSGFVLLRADVTANDANDQALLKHYGLLGPPATLFFGSDGREQRAQRLIGYEDTDAFLARLHKVAP